MQVKKSLFKLLFLILIVAIVILIMHCLKNKQFKDFFYGKRAVRENLILDLKNEKIKVDDNNIVILSDKYNNLAENNYIKVFNCDNEECLVSFLYKAGFPDEDVYVIYSSTDDELIKKYIDKNLYKFIKKIDNNWYLVQYN